jgi:hypothetical protein
MKTTIENSSAVPCPESGVAELFTVRNTALERLLFDRNMLSYDFQRTCLRASEFFIGHLGDEIAQGGIAELVILSKGLAYQLNAAVAAAASIGLPVNLIATRRVEVAGAEATIEVSYHRFDAGGDTLIIGDTVASGATIVSALQAYQAEHSLRRVFLMSFAGSLVGARRISAFCHDLGIELTILFGLAAFGLGENGFDLAFEHPDTITSPEYRERARAQFDGRPVSAVGWDFGSQAMAPTKYRQLCWMEAEKWGLHGHPAFAVEQRPTDLALLAGESGAFST